MAAVTRPWLGDAPAPAKRRRWLVAVVLGWLVVVVVVGSWSVWHDPATVPEQRTISQALPELQRAAGVVYAAADQGERAVVLGELEIVGDCRITPVRHGYLAARDLTVYVREGDAETALDEIAGGLPAGYESDVAVTRGGTRVGMHADAGNFIGIDTGAQTTAKVLTLRLTSGCRPGPPPTATAAPAAGPAPGELRTVVTGLGGSASAIPGVRTVACPDGGVAAGYTVDVGAPADLEQRMARLTAGTTIVRAEAAGWAYRKGSESVVVVPVDRRVRVNVATSC